jgi:hypothetical protein
MRAIFANSLDFWSHSQWACDSNQPVETKKLHGLTIQIETPQYGLRQGQGWMSASPADYGYIANTTGADGDEIDCYIGPNPESKQVFIVDQNKLDGSGQFDEHKIIFGCVSKDEAKQLYLDGHTEGEQIFRAISPVSLARLKLWLRTDDHSQPFAK